MSETKVYDIVSAWVASFKAELCQKHKRHFREDQLLEVETDEQTSGNCVICEAEHDN